MYYLKPFVLLFLLYTLCLGQASCTEKEHESQTNDTLTDAGGTDLTAVCGNGKIEGEEDCEESLDLNETCESLSKGIGQLICNERCRYDYSGCVSDPEDSFTVKSEISSAIGTVGIVTWSISVPIDEAYIEFGLDTNYGMRAPVDLAEPQYRTLLLGMKGKREYHFRIVAKDSNTEYKSDDYALTTGPVTNLVHVTETNVLNTSALERGFIVTSLLQEDWSPMRITVDEDEEGGLAFIVDADGDIVWWWSSRHIPMVVRARMSYDGRNMWLVGAGTIGSDAFGAERVTMDGLDSQYYDNIRASHDITPVVDDVMAFVQGEIITCAAITEITPDGNTRVVFDSSTLWDPADSDCHGNAVRYSEKKGVYTYSDMLQSDILIIDRSTGSVVHQISQFGTPWSLLQHGHQLLDDSIMVFTNSDSVAHEYAIDTDKMQLHEIWSYKSDYISAFLGDVQRLPNGNTLVTYSIAGQIHEVDSNSNLVMSTKLSASVGYSVWRKSLYGPPPDTTL